VTNNIINEGVIALSKYLIAVFVAVLLAGCGGMGLKSDPPAMKSEKTAHPDAYKLHQSGVDKLESGDFVGARADYDKAIERSPDFAHYYFLRGLARLKLKDLDGAVADETRAIQLSPDRESDDFFDKFEKGRYFGARAEAYGDMNRPKDQLNDLDQAIKYAPTWIEHKKRRDELLAKSEVKSRPAAAPVSVAKETHRAGDDASHCAIKWGNSVKNNCNQEIQAHTTRSKVCTEGSFRISAGGSVFINCTDVRDVWVDRAIFTGN
jgi:tetratricopeptide (TPR) repeat protein